MIKFPYYSTNTFNFVIPTHSPIWSVTISSPIFFQLSCILTNEVIWISQACSKCFMVINRLGCTTSHIRLKQTQKDCIKEVCSKILMAMYLHKLTRKIGSSSDRKWQKSYNLVPFTFKKEIFLKPTDTKQLLTTLIGHSL